MWKCKRRYLYYISSLNFSDNFLKLKHNCIISLLPFLLSNSSMSFLVLFPPTFLVSFSVIAIATHIQHSTHTYYCYLCLYDFRADDLVLDNRLRGFIHGADWLPVVVRLGIESTGMSIGAVLVDLLFRQPCWSSSVKLPCHFSETQSQQVSCSFASEIVLLLFSDS